MLVYFLLLTPSEFQIKHWGLSPCQHFRFIKVQKGKKNKELERLLSLQRKGTGPYHAFPGFWFILLSSEH
jgi:hypothetical protein